MKKKTLLVALLLMAVGFAAVTTTLLINGTSVLKKNTDDFKVYYSNAKVNGIEDSSVVVDDTHLSFKTTLDTLGQTYVLDYDVTNSSKNYDSKLTMNCTGGNEWLTVVNTFNTTDNLSATDTRSGKLTLTLAKSYTGNDLDVEIECTINANAVERNSMAAGTPAAPVQPKSYKIGDEIQIADEKFNIIAIEDENLKVLAKKGLDSNYRQSDTPELMQFATEQSWEPHNVDIDIFSTNGQIPVYVNGYLNYLKSETGLENLSGDLIKANQFISLGCEYDEGKTTISCVSSEHLNWLNIDQNYWVATSGNASSNFVWVGYGDYIYSEEYDEACNFLGDWNETCDDVLNAVRPVITIPISVYEAYKNKPVDAETFCLSKDYPYGMLNANTFYVGPTETGDLADAYYICSDTEEFYENEVVGYDINGNQVYYWCEGAC